MKAFPPISRAGCVLALWAAAGAAEAQRGSRPLSRPPRIRTNLAPVTPVVLGQNLRFFVRARDPDGQRLSLTLLNPQPGLVFDPVHEERSPATVVVRWHVPSNAVGRTTLVFEARDEGGLCTRLERVIESGVDQHTAVLTGDVTGDDVLDVVALAHEADLNGVFDAGAIYVWAGSSAPDAAPRASLSVPQARIGDWLGYIDDSGYAGGQGLQLADVTGDGVDDVVATTPNVRCMSTSGYPDGAIFVFEGGSVLAGAVTPRATLLAPRSGGLGIVWHGQGVLFGDVTADGVLDIVAGAWGGGAVHVWPGGIRLSGRPTAVVLTFPGATSLGLCDGQGLQLCDVTGDGVLDIVAGAQHADVGGVVGAGAVHVWAGGPTLATSPRASLTVPGASAMDQLGEQYEKPGIRVADVTDDGFLDVVAGSTRADVDGVVDAGAIYVFAGGPALAGSVSPRVRLTDPTPGTGERMGPDGEEGFRIADVTGDGRLEIVAVSLRADVAGVRDAGELFVFRVGASTGSLAPLAVLSVPGAHDSYRLAGDLHLRRGLYIVDVTGDGILDLIATATSATVGGVKSAGAIHLFEGGNLAGSVAPTATLTAPGASPDDWLGGIGLRFVDVTRDGTLDIVAMSNEADVAGVQNAGAIQIFAGDSGFTGSQAPLATLSVPGAVTNDRLRLEAIADVTGDGALDLVTRSPSFVGTSGVGAIHVFSGAGSFAGASGPSATLVAPVLASSEGLWFEALVDVTGDGLLDVVARSNSGGLGVQDAGALLVYRGGPMSGEVAPTAVLGAPGASVDDRMFLAAPPADVTGDGVLDLLGGSLFMDPGGVVDAGALCLFPGGRGLLVPVVLDVPSAQPGDRLGW